MIALDKSKKLFEKQQYEAALDEVNQFLQEHKDHADGLYVRAMCFRKLDEFEKSVTDLSAIIKRLPNEASLFCERGISHFHNKNIEAALKDMNQAVALDSDNPFRYSSRAYIRAKTDIDGAIQDYEKAIELDPKDEISLNNLGLLQENSGKMRAAKKTFKKSNDLIGYDPEKRGKTVKSEESNPEQSLSMGKVMLSVFTSKNVRREYFNYWKSIFKKNN
jgi:tetratricopeptide (TPR) repeat protein